MTVFILVIGILIGLIGLFGIVDPVRLIGVIADFWKRPRGLYLAVGIRLIFGTALLGVAPQTRFPLAMQVIAVLSLAGAFALPAIGHHRIQRLLHWWSARPPFVTRIWAASALLFALFLVYACS